MSEGRKQFRDIVFGEGYAPSNKPNETDSYYCTWPDGCIAHTSILTWGAGMPAHIHGCALCEKHAHEAFSDDELAQLLANDGTFKAAKYYRADRKAYIAVIQEDDVEPTFESFETYAEALACIEATEYKAWIIGPKWIEDHS